MITQRLRTGLTFAFGLTATVAVLLLLKMSSAAPPRTYAQVQDGHSIYYVALDGNCGGMSPCYDTIQVAVDAADNADDVVKVAAGTYATVSVRPRADFTTTGTVTQVVYLSKTVVIQGGYVETNWITPYPITQTTVLDARGQGRVLYVTGKITPTVEGLHVTGGDATGLGGTRFTLGDAGGGIYIISATTTLRNNWVFGNFANYGGGIYNALGKSVLINVILTGNTAGSGGGMYNDDSNPTLTNVVLSDNTAGTYGGGIYNSPTDSPKLVNVAFYGNVARDGGGMATPGGGWPTLVNVVFSGNTARRYGGAMYAYFIYLPRLTNVTLAYNVARSQGGAIYNGIASQGTLRNCILWGNNAGAGGDQLYNTPNYTPTIRYCLVQGGCPSGADCSDLLTDDPLFLDADGADDIPGTPDDDLRLEAASPAVNAGDNAALPKDFYDLDGDGDVTELLPLDLGDNWRTVNGIVDIGAYERQLAYEPSVASITPSRCRNDSVVHITSLAGAGFQPWTTAKLTRPGKPDIRATNLTVVSDSQISCDFDLRGVSPGMWTVRVTNPDAQYAELVNSFTVDGLVFLPLIVRH